MDGWIDINFYAGQVCPPSTIKAVISSRFESTSKLIYAKFENSRNGGCGVGKIRCTRELSMGHAIAAGDLMTVTLTTIEGGTRINDDEEIYLGLVLDVTEKWDDGGTLEIRTAGLFCMLPRILFVSYIASANVEVLVTALFNWTIKGKSWCKDDTSKISLSSPVTPGDVEFEFTPSDEAIKKLAILQQSVEYGVDTEGIFYFRDEETDIVDQYQVGLNATDIKKTTKGRDIVNAIFVRCNHVLSSGSLIRFGSNSASITTYRQRTKLLTAPEFKDVTKIDTWMTNYLSKTKDPQDNYSFQVPSNTVARWPNGKIKLIDSDGTALTTSKILSIVYTFKGGNIDIRYKIGDENVEYEPGDEIVELQRELAYLENQEISRHRIEHTGYEEFMQYVQQDAIQFGRYNFAMIEFEDDQV